MPFLHDEKKIKAKEDIGSKGGFQGEVRVGVLLSLKNLQRQTKLDGAPNNGKGAPSSRNSDSRPLPGTKILRCS